MHVGLSPLQAGGDFEATLQECERAEAAGFDSVWLGEHHIWAFEETYFRWPHPVVKRPAGDLTIERLSADRIILGDPASCSARSGDSRRRSASRISSAACRWPGSRARPRSRR